MLLYFVFRNTHTVTTWLSLSYVVFQILMMWTLLHLSIYHLQFFLFLFIYLSIYLPIFLSIIYHFIQKLPLSPYTNLLLDLFKWLNQIILEVQPPHFSQMRHWDIFFLFYFLKVIEKNLNLTVLFMSFIYNRDYAIIPIFMTFNLLEILSYYEYLLLNIIKHSETPTE